MSTPLFIVILCVNIAGLFILMKDELKHNKDE